MADFKASLPLEYLQKHLECDVRPDGRELGQTRPTTLNLGSIVTADQSSLVKLGNTTVVCGITAELGTPSQDAPNKGSITTTVELPALCSPLFRSSTNPDLAQVASHFLSQLIHSSGCVNLEDLCVEKSKHAWSLQCDVVCVEYDGNLLDACCLALIAALHNIRLSVVNIDEETGQPVISSSSSRNLSLLCTPVATSFSIIDSGVIIVDPTAEEEALSAASMTVVMRDEEQLSMIYKPGGRAVSDQQLHDCIVRAKQRRREVIKLIQKTAASVQAQR